MPDAQKLPDNDPRIVAWEAYKQTEEYANTQRWASAIDHTEGSLWAAFLEGWTRAATAQAVTLTTDDLLTPEVIKAAADAGERVGWENVLTNNAQIYHRVHDLRKYEAALRAVLPAIIDRLTNGASTP